jgi:ankyrin repeat protein
MKKVLLLLAFCFSFNMIFAQENLNVFDIARNGSVEEAMEVLKTNSEAFNVKNSEGFSPLILACYRGNTEVVELLIENGSDVNDSSSMGTALMAAAVKGNLEIVQMLLDKKASVNVADANGTTALIYAAMFKKHEVVALLIRAKANFDFKDNTGNSAIEYALLADDDKLIEILKTKWP